MKIGKVVYINKEQGLVKIESQEQEFIFFIKEESLNEGDMVNFLVKEEYIANKLVYIAQNLKKIKQ